MPAEPLLDTDLLRAFVAVAETGSFTAAAALVGRSQSAVSQKVIRLEEMLERSVFARTSRSLRLTPDGERLLVVARQMLALNDDFLRSLRRPSEIGTLRLGISENLVPTQLPKLLSRFFIRCSTARRADRGPSPGRRASCWTSASISVEAMARW